MSFDGSPQLLPHQVPAFQGNNVVAMTTTGDDRRLHVEFFVKQVYLEAQSQIEGRPLYKSVNMVLIEAPGAKSNIIKEVQMEDRADCPSHPHRFPGQWQAFMNQQAQIPDGTPLEMCKFIAPHRVLELKGMRVYTAEQLADMPDSTLQNLGMGARREADLCAAYLKDDVKVNALSEALARESSLKADMEMLKSQLANLNAEVAGRLNSGHTYQTPKGPVREAPDPERPVYASSVQEAEKTKRKYTRRNKEAA